MIVQPRDPRMAPDIQAIVICGNSDKLTGDAVFADTDLVRIPYDGILIANFVATATGDGELFVPQIHHQENRSNNVPILNSGVCPDISDSVSYKIPIHKGDTPRILWDKANDTNMTALGAFFRGMNLKKINNPIAFNTPDVQVFKQVTATDQNVLEGSDLEDFPLPGMLLVWACSSGTTSTLQIMQKGHQTGNTSAIPQAGSGLCVYPSNISPYKMYVPATGNPTVTITVNNSETISVCCGMYVDWASVSPRLRARMGY